MPTESCRVLDTIAASPEEVYEAWLDGKRHAAMTGAAASSADVVGERFTAWDGYIEGTTLHLEPGRRIVQAWRTTEFPDGSPDSRLEVLLAPDPAGGTVIVIVHSDIPEGQAGQYEQGWQDHYFDPMKEYFAKASARRAKAPAKASGRRAKAVGKARGAKKRAPKRAKKSARPARKTGRSRR